MAAAVTYEGDVRRSDILEGGGLFEGRKLWFSRGVPAREWLIQNAEQNGARVVQLEQQADIKLVDHARKNQAPGTHSYRYVELSIRNGRLEDLDAHRVGSSSRVERPVGSTVTAPKGTRSKFTNAEDQLLWNWMKPYVDAGGAWKGNEVYKQLEAAYPNHTYQSWRDRWIKHTQFQNRHVTAHEPQAQVGMHQQAEENSRPAKRQKVHDQAQTTSQRANISAAQSKRGRKPSQVAQPHGMGNIESTHVGAGDKIQDTRTETTGQHVRSENKTAKHDDVNAERDQERVKSDKILNEDAIEPERSVAVEDSESSVSADVHRLPLAYDFTQDEARMLYKATCHILDARTDKLDESWSGVAKEWGHSKEAWRRYFYEVIVPEYKKRNGIRNDAELEAHYKTQLREQRARAERALALKRQQEETRRAEIDGTQKEAQDMQISIDRTEEDQEGASTRSAQLEAEVNISAGQTDRANILTVGDAGDNDDVSVRPHGRINDIFNSQLSFPPSTTNFYLPPKPNESRKLSPSKGSHSLSSQSRSQPSSTSISQPLQNSQSLKLYTNASEPEENGKSDQPQTLQVIAHEVRSAGTRQRTEGLDEQARQEQETDKQPELISDLPTTQKSGESGELSGRFVTQISRGEQTTSSQSSSGLHDIPHRPSTPVLSRPPNEALPLAFERLQGSSAQLSHSQSNEEWLDLSSSPPIVRLVEGDDVLSEGDRYSENAPSEAPSEGIYFESQAELTQGWDTAPVTVHPEITAQPVDEDDEDGSLGDAIGYIQSAIVADQPFDDPRDQEYVTLTAGDEIAADDRSSDDQIASSLQTAQSTTDVFETAPAPVPRIESIHDEATVRPDSRFHGKPNHRLETQALFEQVAQTDLAELAAIPEPPGGWDDGVLEVRPIRVQNDIVGDLHVEADWTMPLPDPDLELDEAPSSSREDDGAGVDDWLALQPKIYSTIPSLLLKPLSHRALESTSMDLDLATVVLASMVQCHEKDQHPARLTVQELRRLPKQKHKSTISKMVEELVPLNLKGCWTREDDQALLGVSGREIKRAGDKHGEQGLKKRFEFLEMWHQR